MKKYLVILSQLALANAAQAERTFEEKKFLLQSSTVVSSLIYSGHIMAMATLAFDKDCKVTKEVQSSKDSPDPKKWDWEYTYEVSGDGCSIYFHEHKIGGYNQGLERGHAEILFISNLTSKTRPIKTASFIGDFKVNYKFANYQLLKQISKLSGSGFYSDGKKVTLVDTNSEVFYSSKSSVTIDQLRYSSKAYLDSSTHRVELNSHKTSKDRTETQATIDDVEVTQSDLETMFPNTYKKSKGGQNENRYYDFVFNE